MKTPKKAVGSVTPNMKNKNKQKLDTPMPEKIISQKLETPKSGKKNKQKEAQTPKESNLVKEKIETPMQTKINKTPKAKTPKHVANGKTPEAQKNSETPKAVTSNKKKNIANNNSNENIVSNSPNKKGKENLKNSSKKRPLEEGNSVNKKAKVDINKEQTQSSTQVPANQKSESDEIVINFPSGATCYKNVLKQILDISQEVSSPRSLIISFKNPEEAKKKIPQLKKLKVGEENITIVPFEDDCDPLKRVAVMRFHDADPEEVQKTIGAVSCAQLISNAGKANGIFIFKFSTKEAANEAESKTYDVNGKSITLRKYFVDQNTKEEPIVTEGKKRKLDQISAPTSAKQSKTEDDDEDEDEDDEDEEDEDEAGTEAAEEVEGEDEEEEEEDDDDDDEEEDEEDDDDDE